MTRSRGCRDNACAAFRDTDQLNLLFDSFVVLHVIAGTVGLVSFWVPIAARKGGTPHRRWGRIACFAFMGAGALAVAMALLSLFGPEQRLPMITDRDAFEGLLGWMMLYLGILTIGFADFGLAVVRYRQRYEALRAPRHQLVIAAVVLSAGYCAYFGLRIGEPLMPLVAALGLTAMVNQQRYIWRRENARGSHVHEHLGALMGMGISAYTAFLSVGLIRLFPEQVFSPVVWAVPSVIGVTMMIYFNQRVGQRRIRLESA